jgi:hypothetical protein
VSPAAEQQVYGLRALPPALALTDLYNDPKGWHPDMDDLDIPEADVPQLAAAARLIGAELPASLASRAEMPSLFSS